MQRICRQWRVSSCSMPPQAASSKRCCQAAEQRSACAGFETEAGQIACQHEWRS
jgi:hypothetical protein